MEIVHTLLVQVRHQLDGQRVAIAVQDLLKASGTEKTLIGEGDLEHRGIPGMAREVQLTHQSRKRIGGMVQAVDNGELEFPKKLGKGTCAHGMRANGDHVDEVADRGVKVLLRASDRRHADDHLVLAGVTLQQEAEEAQEDNWKAHALGFGKSIQGSGSTRARTVR